MSFVMVFYAHCDACGEVGCCIAELDGNDLVADVRRTLDRCPECKATGRVLISDMERPDPRFWPSPAALFDLLTDVPLEA